jgi:hypothetical protein
MVDTVNSADWQNVLKLLMLTMLSDGRNYERQVDTFVNASIDLRQNLNVRGVQTRQMTMDWYIRNRAELVDVHSGETFEHDLLALIDSLDTLPNKKPLIRALKNLARRDSERKETEQGVVSMSRERWG